MKHIIHLALPLLLTASALRADQECLEASVYESNEMYHTGSGCEDGIFNAVSSSMIAWGIGLAAGIALLTGLIHNAHQGSQTSSTNSSSSQ